MNQHTDQVQSMHQEHCTTTTIDRGLETRKIQTNRTPATDPQTITRHRDATTVRAENEMLRICQALLLSTCMLLLSYHSIRYGRTEYSILENGKIAQGYANRAVVTLSLGYSVPYSMISVMAIGMLAYSLASKRPRWSLPSIILYLVDLVYDVSGAIVVIWLLFANTQLSTAFSYTIGTTLLILGEVWMWLGVLRLYEERTFRIHN